MWIRNGESDKIAKKLKIKLSRIPFSLRLSKKILRNGNYIQLFF
jgi:hypothetical protein